jgi:hypothetical protein
VGCTRGEQGMYWVPKFEQLMVGGEKRSDYWPDHMRKKGITPFVA